MKTNEQIQKSEKEKYFFCNFGYIFSKYSHAQSIFLLYRWVGDGHFGVPGIQPNKTCCTGKEECKNKFLFCIQILQKNIVNSFQS